ncbi:hypothetical protein HR060_01865 [Catenovulum sp. SM1970]|uniref:hypothetical protein n=1 Tax=Marinifaba aquimaris TaxID=2741323 RepID=UPI001571EC17|nr:hypothetical protein [Marinifaba aquimaris]NTS75600.1 hypothetical protein [Marinifaba aquimaris]
MRFFTASMLACCTSSAFAMENATESGTLMPVALLGLLVLACVGLVLRHEK